ncbi:cubilin-like [Dreissena polymorpha]|uniref:CUB domain-containing protein n=1 Tax=Dreissena polymorpha TaxID=45954 RepID=A0A9D4R543_DREPO|nr:cubilin-like [Dreissena polymorpha]XP_052273364.1 cubilin-like [Dreissena polymorpha]KAH3855299.1 hypothetical protein DPMN_097864 [Dreissena polymorpha]
MMTGSGAVLATLLFACLLIVQRVDSQCSGSALTLQASTTPQKFSSPGYPIAYNNDLSCTWLLDSGVDGQRILLYSDAYSIHCPSDSVDIYDGNSTSSPGLQAGLCGSSKTGEFVTRDRHALVTFRTDASLTERGFEFIYLSAADTSGTGCNSEYTLTASEQAQFLTSQNFPAFYSSNSFCRWEIVPSSAQSAVSVQVTFADIEADDNCRYDKMEIYDGSYICENKLVSTYCPFRTGTDFSPSTYTSAEAITVILRSDNSFERHGFILKYWETTVTTTTTVATTVTTTVTSSTALQTTAAAPTTAALTTQASPVTSEVPSISIKEQNTDASTNIVMMVVSGLSGAGGVLALLAVWRTFRYINGRKRPKKGLIHVQGATSLTSISISSSSDSGSLQSRQGPPPSILAFV